MNTPLPSEWIAHDQSLKPYLRSQKLVSLAGTCGQLAVVAWLIFGGLGEQIQSRAYEFQWGFSRWVYFFAVVGFLFKLVGFPFSYAHYYLERSKGLSRQDLGSWLIDQVKGIAVGIVLGVIVLYAFYAIASSGSPWWWLWIWLFLMTFSIALAQLAPVLLLPLFIKMKPMEAGLLKDKLLALSAKFKVSVKEVYHLGLGEKTEKGNAAFMGLGETKRIVIGDTLYEKFPMEEVEAVFAHELGHQVHNDLWKGLGLSAGLMLVTLGLAQKVAVHLSLDVSQPLAFLGFLMIWTVSQMPFNVIQAIYSRNREWAADRFASETTQMAQPLGSALERLTYQNQGLFRPNRVWEFLTYSHPAPWRRIIKLRDSRISS